MDGGGHVEVSWRLMKRTEFYARGEVRQAKRTAKAHPDFSGTPIALSQVPKKSLVRQFMHRKFTVHPQVFHT
jgi:hypothetical protein